MSPRYKYVPATAAVEYITGELDPDEPTGQPTVVLYYDEAIVLHGTHAQLTDLTDRIRAALDHHRDT